MDPTEECPSDEKYSSACAKSLHSLGRKWMNKVRQPDDLEELYRQIRAHPRYSDPAAVSSLTRWILEEVVVGKLSSGELTDLANADYARSLWEYLYWNYRGEIPFDEGEGREEIFKCLKPPGDAIESPQK